MNPIHEILYDHLNIKHILYLGDDKISKNIIIFNSFQRLGINPIIIDCNDVEFDHKQLWILFVDKICQKYNIDHDILLISDIIDVQKLITDKHLHILFLNAEKLKYIGHHPLFMISSLGNRINISTIFIYETNINIMFEYFTPFVINASLPNREEMKLILTQYLTEMSIGIDSSQMANVINIILSLYYPICRNSAKLIQLAEAIMCPQKEEEYSINREFKNLLSLYHRFISPTNDPKSPSGDIDSKSDYLLKLPLTHKFILLSAFIASFQTNTQSITDTYKGKKKRKQNKTKNKGSIESEKLLFPATFTTNRLITVFRFVSRGWQIHSNYEFSFGFQTAVKSLINHKYIVDVSTTAITKLNCTMTLNEANAIAKSIGFDLNGIMQV